MSPSGDWNVYVMDAYRQVGMREEMHIKRFSFEVEKKADFLSLDLTIRLEPIIANKSLIDVGVASVIQAMSGKETYWALVHPLPEADFHVRESFRLEL